MDKSVSRTLFLRGFQLVSGLCVAISVPLYLSEVEQGYYYTFASLVAMQIFFELGLSQVLVYRFAYLYQLRSENIGTDLFELRQLLYAARFIFRILGVAFVFVMLIIGTYFFSALSNQGINWLGPWILLIIATSVNLVQSVKLSYLEAIGHLKHVSVARLRSNILATIIFFFVISAGGGLWSTSVFPVSNAVYITIWLTCHNSTFPYRIERELGQPVRNRTLLGLWIRDVYPLQWKISLSWLSGYFIFQLYTPITFAHFGPIQAGKLGYLISITSALVYVATTFTTSCSPRLSSLFASGHINEYNKLFDQSFINSLLALFLFHVFLLLILLSLPYHSISVSEKMLSFSDATIYCCSSFICGIINCLAVYLRCQQREPLLLLSICSALTTSTLLWIGSSFSLSSMLLMPLLANFLFLGWAFSIYSFNRKGFNS